MTSFEDFGDKAIEFESRGFCILDDVVSVDLIDNFKEQTLSYFDDCLSIIEQKKLPFGIGIKHGFKEIVQRHEKRYEMPHRMDEINRDWIMNNSIIIINLFNLFR